jgi:hypothetical protein
MIRDIFKVIRLGAATVPRQPVPPTARAGLTRDLMRMLVSGPVGVSDPVLWTLLLRDHADRRSGENEKQKDGAAVGVSACAPAGRSS